MTQSKAGRWRRMTLRALGALGIGIALSGCIIEPLWSPHHYHPYYHDHGYRGY